MIPNGNFYITISGGSVVLDTALDFEEIQQYVLTIRAQVCLMPQYQPIMWCVSSSQDLGVPALSSVAELTVNVQDVNDNPPVFSQNLYVISVLENVTMVSA